MSKCSMVVSVSLCYRRTGPHRPRWDRAGDRVETSSTECLNNTSSGPASGPTTPHLVPSFTTPGRTGSTLPRQSAVPLSSFPKSVHDCGAVTLKYRTYSSGGSYVGLPPPGPPGEQGDVDMPLVADIPAPGQFSSMARSKEDSITC